MSPSHGDVVSEVPNTTNAAAMPLTTPIDAFGAPTTSAGANLGSGFLGAKRRNTTLNSGTVEMGARLYQPQIGRFLQPDPIYGGSLNAYDYANQDPVNQFDLSGNCSAKASHKWTLHAITSPRCWYAGIKDDLTGGNGPWAQGAIIAAASYSGGEALAAGYNVFTDSFASSGPMRALANAMKGYSDMDAPARGAPHPFTRR
jgi:RHS repeat-associated protein